MPSVETIYRETIRPLPVDDQMRLAEMIRENVGQKERSSKPKRSALEILQSINVKPIFRTSAEVDEYLKTERDSWDR
jgi:hypothetical protein